MNYCFFVLKICLKEKYCLFRFANVRDKIPPGYCMESIRIRSFSSPYFPAFELNTGKYGPEKIPNTNTFHAVALIMPCHSGVAC